MNKSFRNWQTKKLGEVCRITYGKGLPTKDLKENGFPVFGANGIIGFNDKYLYEESQVLISCRGAYSGKINFSPPLCFVTNNSLILEIISNEDLDKRFLYYILHTVNKSKLVTGTAQPQVTINNAVELTFQLPPLETQHAIVSKIEELFSELDQGIADLKTAQEQLKVYRQSVLKYAFEGNKFKKNNLRKLKDITSKIGSGSTPKGGSDSYFDSGIPLVRSLNIHFECIKYKGLAFIDNKQAEKLKNVIINENDVLLNITGASIGRVNIAPKEFHNGRVNQHVSIIRPKNNSFLPKYLKYFIQTSEIQNWISNANYGVTRQALTKSMLENLEVPLPPIEEQHLIVQEIENRLSVADKMEESIQESLQKAEALRQSILKKAFSGQLL